MAQVVEWHYAMSVQIHRIENAPEGILTIQAEADLHFFLVALSNLLKSINLVGRVAAPRVRQKITSGVETFHQEIPGSVNLRNVLEHYDSYLTGDGRLQKSAKRLSDLRYGLGDPVLLMVAGMPGQDTITAMVPGVDEFSVTIESALAAAQRLTSVVDHALD